MRINPKILIVRIIMGLAGGWFLTKFFLSKGSGSGGVNWITVLILAALIVLAATASEAWRRRNK